MKRHRILLIAFVTSATFITGQAQANVSLTAETNHPTTSTFALGDPVEITFSVEGLAADEKVSLTLDVQNEYGKSLAMPTPVSLSGDEDGNAQYVFSPPANKLGYYEIKAKLSDGTSLSSRGTRPEGIITYAVVPDPATRIDYGDTGSRFGLQGGFSKSVVVLPYLGARYVLSGNDWAKMEPKTAGEFQTNRTKADQAGKRFPPKAEESESPLFQGSPWTTYPISLIIAAKLPTWALKTGTAGKICKSSGALNEDGEKALPNFARAQSQAFAADYKDQKSRYYQVTWEPQFDWCYAGTSEDLIKIFKQSYQAIHQGDPHAVVAGPTLFVEPLSSKQLNELWAAGLGKYIDALALHPYGPQWPPEKNGMQTILKEQVASATKAVGHPIPFIGTEHGFMSVKIGNLNKALGDIRSTLIMLGEGASVDFGFYVADFWESDNPNKTEGYGFYWNLNPKIKFGTDKLAPKAIVPAFAAMTSFLDGTTSKGALPDLQGTQMGYQFTRDKTVIDVVWDYAAKSTFAVPQNASVCDWMGNCAPAKAGKITIGGAPTYFVLQHK